MTKSKGQRFPWRRALGLRLRTLGLLACRDATQATLVLRPNVPFATGANVAVWASGSGRLGEPVVQSEEPWLQDGEIGDIVVVPEGAKDGWWAAT